MKMKSVLGHTIEIDYPIECDDHVFIEIDDDAFKAGIILTFDNLLEFQKIVDHYTKEIYEVWQTRERKR